MMPSSQVMMRCVISWTSAANRPFLANDGLADVRYVAFAARIAYQRRAGTTGEPVRRARVAAPVARE